MADIEASHVSVFTVNALDSVEADKLELYLPSISREDIVWTRDGLTFSATHNEEVVQEIKQEE